MVASLLATSLLLLSCAVLYDFGDFDSAQRAEAGTTTATSFTLNGITPNSIKLHRGEQREVVVSVERRAGSGGIALAIEGVLPPSVKVTTPVVIESDANTAKIVFAVEEDAPFTDASVSLRITATPLSGGQRDETGLSISIGETTFDKTYGVVFGVPNDAFVASTIDDASNVYVLTSQGNLHRIRDGVARHLRTAIQIDGEIEKPPFDVVVHPSTKKLLVLFDSRLRIFSSPLDPDADVTMDVEVELQKGSRQIGVLADGRIMIAGILNPSDDGSSFQRLLPDGTVDPTFDVNSALHFADGEITEAKIEMQGNATLVWGRPKGSTQTRIARLTADAKIDRDFGNAGFWTGDSDDPGGELEGLFPTGIRALPDGRILISGTKSRPDQKAAIPVLVGLTANGMLDRSFGVDAIVVRSSLRSGSGGGLGFDQTTKRLYVGGSDYQEKEAVPDETPPETLELHSYRVSEVTPGATPERILGNVFPRDGETDGVFRSSDVHLTRARAIHVENKPEIERGIIVVGSRDDGEVSTWFVARVIP